MGQRADELGRGAGEDRAAAGQQPPIEQVVVPPGESVVIRTERVTRVDTEATSPPARTMDTTAAGRPEAGAWTSPATDATDRSATSRLDDDAEAAIDDVTPEEAQIRAEMEQTRREMSQTIDAIQERLNPDDLKEQAKDVAQDVAEQVKSHVSEAVHEAADHAKSAVRDATIGRVEDFVGIGRHRGRGGNASMLDRIRANPVPTALVGLGLGWLFMKGKQDDRPEYDRYGYGDRDRVRTGYGGRTDPTYRMNYGAESGTEYSERPSGTYRAYGGEYRAYGYDADTGEGDEGAMHAARRRLGDAAEGVGERASHLASNVGDMAGNAGHGAKGAGSDLLETIRANPLPAALTGIGLTWLYMNRAGNRPMTQSVFDYDESGRPRYRYDQDFEWDGMDNPYGSREVEYENRSGRGVTGRVADTASQAGERVSDAASTAKETVTDAASTVGERASDLVDAAQERVSDLASNVGDMAGGARRRIRRAPGGLEQMVQDNPLALGAASLALGAVVGMLLPETEREQELMGATRDRVMERAQTKAHETVEKVQNVASEVGSTVEREADKQGLTGSGGQQGQQEQQRQPSAGGASTPPSQSR